MERHDIFEMVQNGKHYMDKAEQARWSVMECQKRYDETIATLDKIRRRMVFVENGTPEFLELVDTIMVLEKLREEKKGLENKLKIFMNASLSYTLTAVESLTIDSTYITNHIALVLRQAVMLIRAIRELDIDLSCIYAQTIKTRIIVNYINTEKRMRDVNISRYLNQLISSME